MFFTQYTIKFLSKASRKFSNKYHKKKFTFAIINVAINLTIILIFHGDIFAVVCVEICVKNMSYEFFKCESLEKIMISLRICQNLMNY